ncbi:methionine-R-sulfoxide reductase B1-like isoform X2 [Tubulanus polymorphus]|uniref:methionine-R-sulfoxide reductase B1-like isoform X2 n=1 Tax=Tubulanus polymorphus TaxID=672921 RepID=UPI003DA29E7A
MLSRALHHSRVINRRLMSYCSWSYGEKYKDHFENGVYVCVKCDHPLFSSQVKYAHDSAWPAFTETIREDSVSKYPEPDQPKALKLSCGKCFAELGHEFLCDGPKEGLRVDPCKEV